MHNNFYFLRQLSKSLESVLQGSVVSECFSQSKDELIIRFEVGTDHFFIRASLLPDISCLSFPENFQRARKNSVDLFPEIIGRRVSDIRQFSNERSFAICFSENLDLLFKMHGNRTNIALFRHGKVSDLFRKKLSADLNLDLDRLDREIDWSFANFQQHADNLRPVYFTFGKVLWRYLEEQQFALRSEAEQWHLLQSLLKQLETPSFYITLIDGKPVLSLVETGEVKEVIDDSRAAANDFYHSFTHDYAFSKEKARLMNILKAKWVAGQNYCEKNSARLAQLQRNSQYKIWADLIMANLNNISPGSDQVVLENFYAGQVPTAIKLKRDLSPQKNAELFYKKAKNQHIEIARLETAVRQKQEELETIREKMRQVESATDLKSLRSLKVVPDPGRDRKAETAQLPYHEFQFRGYRIWVGKGAQANDKLTLKYSYKDDLWLHAKDVSGSHVLIKHQAGKNFPKDVIEFAASLAAGNSKRKNESLCPVIVTQKKFVRKRKGDPPGAVVVEREEVIMVEPAGIS